VVTAHRRLERAVEKLKASVQPPEIDETSPASDEGAAENWEKMLANPEELICEQELREELAASCVAVAVAVRKDGEKRLRWALKGRSFVCHHPEAMYEEACALQDLDYFAAAVDRFKSLRSLIDGGNQGTWRGK
jgi:hypothetical protein